MQLHLYNTLSRSKEAFKPLDPSMVKIYTCGPTVYSEPHVGNMRPYVFSDILRSVIKDIAGYPVKHVVNMTDVGHLTGDENDTGEDKLEKGSRREGLTTRQVALKYEQSFKHYLTQLNIDPFTYARATEYIPAQIDIVKQLENKNLTYIIPGDGIYMDTSLVPDYGKLMGPNFRKHLEGLQSGARVDDTGKKNPTDFALWKFSHDGETRQMERIFGSGSDEDDRSGHRIIFPGEDGVYVDTPAVDRTSLTQTELETVGFPGRHIECSAMIRECLGEQIDIHRGGVDHIPIHHTDEIAQSECSFCTEEKYGKDRKRVQIWMHNQFLNINGAKVSKSAGDDLSLATLQERGFAGEDLRYFFLQAHYRSFQDFTREGLEAAKRARQNFMDKFEKLFRIDGLRDFELYDLEKLESELIGIHLPDFKKEKLKSEEGRSVFENLCSLVLDDIHTPSFLAEFNKLIGSGYRFAYKNDIFLIILFFDLKILKLGIGNEIIKAMIFYKKHPSVKGEFPNEVILLAAQRRQAKLAKDRSKADTLRDELRSLGYEMNDGKEDYEVVKIG